MNITLVRYRNKNGHIDGRLKSDQGHLCDTLENAEAAIPVGTYQLSIMKCNFRSRKMPVIVLDSTDITTTRCCQCFKPKCVCINSSPHKGGVGGGLLYCPQICPGNGIHNRLDGAIIVGTSIAPGCLGHPKQAFTKVYDILRKSAERGHDIILTIKNSFNS